jgi:uncharacterized protein YciI
MAYAIVLLKYRFPLERMLQTIDAHRGYLRELNARGKMLASGPLVPRDGGALLLRYDTDEELAALIAGDPFQKEGLVDTTVHVWAPNIGVEGLDGLAKG